MDLANLSALQTEGRNPRTAHIDELSTYDMCKVINEEDAGVAKAVEECLPIIAEAINAMAPRVRQGGRVIYVGAGTSGRLGILDASEIPPTFSAPPAQFIGLIAGGDAAIRHAQEGAEDSPVHGKADMKALNLNPDLDTLIGIAASGRTPYVLGCLAYAKAAGCPTVGVACCSPSAMSMSGNVDYMISPLPGPEVVTGSTRLKAGTATKMVLNMLSTGIMIKTGKTYGNLMIDVKRSNFKLEQRSRNLLRGLSDRCANLSEEDLEKLITEAEGSVKIAFIMAETGMAGDTSKHLLRDSGGIVAFALKKWKSEQQIPLVNGHHKNGNKASLSGLMLCIDGGASKCAAVISDHSGILSRGEAGPCNFSTDLGLKGVIKPISTAVQRALTKMTQTNKDSSRAPQLPPFTCFTSAWIGLAGCDRPEAAAVLMPVLREMLGLENNEDGAPALSITNDVKLLAAGIKSHPETNTGVTLIAGTGSVAMSWNITPKMEIQQLGRTGGWGHILGDEGAGFHIGRQGIKSTLTAWEQVQLGLPHAALGPMHRALLETYGVSSHSGAINNPDIDILSAFLGTGHAEDPAKNLKSHVAAAARVVLDMASVDPAAAAILARASDDLAQLVIPLAQPSRIDPAVSTLVLGGGLWRNEAYKSAVLKRLADQGVKFKHVEVVNEPAVAGAAYLAQMQDGTCQ
ncbi:N-acetylmuramic acid 6-phosphate [Xylona heveae TC161]|uniref:N-acetyl-D-glucosamine kinase n=1 Tax=Xylona heveae (strain CBS 132557 / TC161) TaxID=1328760 RepID=A0A164ZV74_XYLHT|nr:N-acetylmuramic acid 6-phosphate [Xylona heveae TC161]KZF19572.1 N-acetylmuramic acid 6-phosphate [Xylona heveae TC161]